MGVRVYSPVGDDGVEVGVEDLANVDGLLDA